MAISAQQSVTTNHLAPAAAGFPLLPSQRAALDSLARDVATRRVAVLAGRPGAGKTSILKTLHSSMGGAYLTSRDFIEASAERHPLALDETVYQVLKRAMDSHQVVIVDDFHLISFVSCCSHSYPRLNFLAAALVPLVKMAQDDGKSVVFATDSMPVPGLSQLVSSIRIPAFTVDDYALLAQAYLGAENTQRLDIGKVHRFAPKLNARQIRYTCEALSNDPSLDTDRFLQHLRENHMASNVDLGEVQEFELNDLKGLDDVLDALEANVILPLENSEVSEELDLKPKRGVLLAGPPGTGKTTIGRALAHRLKSKFFLIDGTAISGTPDFYSHIHRVFESAKQNAPAIIFIDDSDVIFEGGNDTGLYRYLLTMLDGLESASVGRICLMMTAMDVGNLPPALVRSGRIELWLETRLPEEDARAAILGEHCAKLPAAIAGVDVGRLAAESEGLSGADLKRVVEDGKLLFAFERARGTDPVPSTDYFVRAIGTVVRNKAQYAEAESRARARHPVRPSYFDTFAGGGEMMVGHGFLHHDVIMSESFEEQ